MVVKISGVGREPMVCSRAETWTVTWKVVAK